MDVGSKVRVTDDTDHHYNEIGTVEIVGGYGDSPFGCTFQGRDFVEWYEECELEEVAMDVCDKCGGMREICISKVCNYTTPCELVPCPKCSTPACETD